MLDVSVYICYGRYPLRQLVSQVLGRIYILILNDEVCFDFDLRATARTVYVNCRRCVMNLVISTHLCVIVNMSCYTLCMHCYNYTHDI